MELPGIGASSYMKLSLAKEQGTISKGMLMPFIFWLKGTIGTSRLAPFIRYSCDAMPDMVALSSGLFINWFLGNAAFSTALN